MNQILIVSRNRSHKRKKGYCCQVNPRKGAEGTTTASTIKKQASEQTGRWHQFERRVDTGKCLSDPCRVTHEQTKGLLASMQAQFV